MVRVRPDLLSRDDASRLWEAGVRDIELDVLSFCDHALKSMRRTYPGKRVTTMCEALRKQGFCVGLVLSPGLPNTHVPPQSKTPRKPLTWPTS